MMGWDGDRAAFCISDDYDKSMFLFISYTYSTTGLINAVGSGSVLQVFNLNTRELMLMFSILNDPKVGKCSLNPLNPPEPINQASDHISTYLHVFNIFKQKSDSLSSFFKTINWKSSTIPYIWVNHDHSLSWIKVIWGWFPL